jgi:5-formyltetrahydrofolate cyclo-ligase
MTGREKEEVRQFYLNLRKKMSPENVARYSRLIFQHLSEWKPVRDAFTVHCFMSIEENREVDTTPIIRWLLEQDKRVVIPKSVKKSRQLKHYVYREHDQLVKNEWGIPEPVEGERVFSNELDLVFVPMIAADQKKNRLGYGLGFYDRFLSGITALKVGLLYESCLSEQPIPVDNHDVQLDYLVTERGIY